MQRSSHLFALLCLACAAAFATEVYRSTGPNGVVEFSDARPDKAGHEAREEQLRALEAALQRAGAQFDLAERALAVARRPLWTGPDPGHLVARPMTRADAERIDFYKRDLLLARKALLDVRQKRNAVAETVLTPSSGTPTDRP